MPETDTNAFPDTGNGAGDQQQPAGEKSFTQADVDRLIGERLKRENISDLKAKATELDQLKASTQTADQKAEERFAKLEADLAAERTEKVRLRIASKHGISTDDADLFLTGSDEETIERQAKALAAKAKSERRNGRHVPGEGTTPTTPEAESLQTVRSLFGGD